jgi:FixJ family two-component response regulator
VSRPFLGPRSNDELQHELDVHQVELEMQNEQLRAAQSQLEDSRARYHELYDLAPIGYVTLDASAKVVQANLRAAETLTDYRLPGMTGDALARHLVRLHPAIPVVYTSGFSGLDLDPAGPILTKPLELDDVAKAVEAAWATCSGGCGDQDP